MKCQICGKKVEKDIKTKKVWGINAAVIGSTIHIKGHKACLQNVDKLIVIPNRMRLDLFED